MRAQFLIVPFALVASAPSMAKTYMTVEQAQELMFPGASFTENFVTLDQDQFNAIIKASNVNVYDRHIKAWKVSTGGWFVLDQVRGKDDWISYAIAINEKGAVSRIEILECLDNYDGITIPEWRAQFCGKRNGSQFDDVQIISGSTLSSGQIAAGVRRVLATYAIVLDPPAG